jgi:hypothetical protein
MTFTTAVIRQQDQRQVIFPSLKNKFFTIFGSTANLDAIYIGDNSISYSKRQGFPIGAISNTISLEFSKKIYVTDSDNWYMAGLVNDQLFILIEDNPFDAWGNLIVTLLNEINSKL